MLLQLFLTYHTLTLPHKNARYRDMSQQSELDHPGGSPYTSEVDVTRYALTLFCLEYSNNLILPSTTELSVSIGLLWYKEGEAIAAM